MNRLYILLTVMVVMVGAFFAGHEALAKVLTGTGDDTLVGTDREDRLKGRGGDDKIKGSGGNDEINPGHGNDKGVRWLRRRPYLRARHRRRGLHRLRGRLRQGRDHTPRRPDPE
jgi:hypothetical protein